MKRLHLALGVADVVASVADYSRRLGAPPLVLVPGEYALWRTAQINFSIRHDPAHAGQLRHLGWEDPQADGFSLSTDCNGIVWEHFALAAQMGEIRDAWPDAGVPVPDQPCSAQG